MQQVQINEKTIEARIQMKRTLPQYAFKILESAGVEVTGKLENMPI